MGVYLGRTPVSMYMGGIKEGVNRFPIALNITNQPNKTKYQAGETLNLDGLEVTITWSDNTTEVVTDQCTFSKNTGDVIYEDTTQIIVTWKWAELETYTGSIPITVTRVLSSITLTSQPTTLIYQQGATLNLSGMVVQANYNSGAKQNVTGYTTSPAAGSKLNTLGSNSVTVSYSEGGVTKTTSFNITVNVKTVAWTTGSDTDVANMISAAHQGLINLEDYWSVGDTRTVTLDNKSYSGNAGNMTTSNEQIQLVLAEKLSVSTSYGKANGFIITTKNCLKTMMKMNSSNINSGSFAGSAMCTFLNDGTNGFLGMLPDWLANNLLTADVVTAQTYNSSTNQTSQHKIFLAAVKEIFGGTATSAGYDTGYSNLTEFNALEQWEYYKTSANRIKQVNGSNDYWWERSPRYDDSSNFCRVSSSGSVGSNYASISFGVAPCFIV